MFEHMTDVQRLDQAIQVSFQYPVCFTTDLFGQHNPLLKDIVCTGTAEGPRKILCIIDRGVDRSHPCLQAAIEAYCHHHRACLTLVGPPLVVPGGEHVKNDPDHVRTVHHAIHAYGIDRHAYVLVIGGGAVIDMVGFAAATAHRGVRLIRVPTTVLAQNDSAVGVKNSVNAFGKKNFLGTFAPPSAVLNDSAFLATLDDRDWRSGIAEAIKVALLKDSAFFAFIERHAAALKQRDLEAMQWLIYRCAQLHLEHIATNGDPFELGSSRPLDFGHWSAHKLEQLSHYRLRHGEAVAIGIALDSTYAYHIGLLPKLDWQRILALITALGLAVSAPELRVRHPDHPNYPAVLDGLNEFREHLGGQLTVMLLERIARGIEVHEVDHAAMIESINLVHTYQAERQGGRA